MLNKYDPDLHSCVVRNVRDEFRSRYNVDLVHLTDENVFDIWLEWSDVEVEGQERDKDLALMEALSEAHQAELTKRGLS